MAYFSTFVLLVESLKLVSKRFIFIATVTIIDNNFLAERWRSLFIESILTVNIDGNITFLSA